MINRYYERIYHVDYRMFRWFNRSARHSLLDGSLRMLTHLGGAIFSITFTLLIAFIAPEPWARIGWQSLSALAISFIITTLIKKKVQRIRPYLALQEVRVGKNPLKDHSFPSGHSTAIFSIITPFLFAASWWALPLILLALIVCISRVYLGLHYPSDCLIGSIVGSATAVLIVLFMSSLI